MKKSSEVNTPRTPACNIEIRAKNMCASFFSLHANMRVSGTTMFASITRGRPIPSIPVMYLTPRELIQDMFSVNCIPAVLSNIVYMKREIMYTMFDKTAGMQFTENISWINSLGVKYMTGIDGIGLPLVILANIVVPLTLIFAWSEKKDAHIFFALISILHAGVLGVFTSLDFFMFY